MATTTTLRITTQHTLADLARVTRRVTANDPKLVLSELQILIDAIKSGCGSGTAKFDLQVGATAAVRASATATYTAKATAAKVVTINGQAFTAKASGAGANEFNIGLTKEDTAANLAAAVNASTTATIKGIVCATAASNAATGTAKCASVVNTNTLQVGNVLFTVKTSLTSTEQSALYYNLAATGEVKVGGSDSAMATNFAAAINNHQRLRELVVATTSTDTVTITALTAGTAANALALIQTGGTITVSAATLTNGHERTGPVGLAVGAVGVVTLYAVQPGKLANTVTTTTDDASPCTVSAATLTGGLGEDVLPVVFQMS